MRENTKIVYQISLSCCEERYWIHRISKDKILIKWQLYCTKDICASVQDLERFCLWKYYHEKLGFFLHEESSCNGSCFICGLNSYTFKFYLNSWRGRKYVYLCCGSFFFLKMWSVKWKTSMFSKLALKGK